MSLDKRLMRDAFARHAYRAASTGHVRDIRVTLK